MNICNNKYYRCSEKVAIITDAGDCERNQEWNLGDVGCFVPALGF